MFRQYRAALRLALPIAAAVLAFAADEVKLPRRMELPDVLKWRRPSATVISNDGRWLAYRTSPLEGDSSLVVRNLQDGKEQKYEVGQSRDGGPGASGDVVFSEDSKWLAYAVSPTFQEGKALKKQKKAPQNKAVLLELASGTKTEFERVKTFRFNGRKANWLLLHLSGGDTPAAPAPQAGGSGAAPSRPQGTDLVLYDLTSRVSLNIGNVSEYACSKPGEWCAWAIDSPNAAANGIQLRHMGTGVLLPADSGKANYKSISFTEKGDALAAVKGAEDKGFEDKLYRLLAWKLNESGIGERIEYDPAQDAAFPKLMTISANRPPQWMDDLSAVVFGINEARTKKEDKKGPAGKGEAAKTPEEKKSSDAKDEPKASAAKKADEEEKPGLVLWHWKDARLQPMQQVQESRDKNFSYTSIYRLEGRKFIRLADESLKDVAVTPRSNYGVGSDIRDYEWMSNLDGRRYQDVYSVNLTTGERKQVLKKVRFAFMASPDARRHLFYQDGDYFTVDLATGQQTNITRKAPTTFVDTEDDHNVVKPPVRPLGWSSDGAHVLLSDNWDIWKVAADGSGAVNLTGSGKKDQTRFGPRYVLDPEEKGVDLSKPMYVRAYGEWNKKGGVALVEPGKPGARMLLWDDLSPGNLIKAKNTGVFLLTKQTSTEPLEIYHSPSPSLENLQKLSDMNPQRKDLLLSAGARLIDYTSDKGDKLQAALYLPANFQAGKKYPTLVIIYEKMSQSKNQFPTPVLSGYNPGFYTSHGYAVLMPDIKYRINDPGMSAVWCVLPAVKAAVATGIVDPSNIGLHGHSWGGYQTSFLVTQTNLFKAAIAGAPLTNLISMYSSVYWNSGSANQPIFESSQGRFTGGYWEQTEAYIRNSPVFHASKVQTPLMILHNDKDGAVDFTQGIEYYNTLRRLQKPVILLQYKGENHSVRQLPNQKDYFIRMQEFWAHHLKGEPAPNWMQEGVPHLKMKEHLEERAKPAAKAPSPATTN